MKVKNIEKKYLPEFIYGSIDGAITTFAIVSGSIGASLSPAIILILGFANLFADGFSMAVSNYLSTKSITKSKKSPNKTALATFLAFITIGFIPLLSFVLAIFFTNIRPLQFELSIALTALAFIIVGYQKGKLSNKSPLRSSFETLLIGAIASAIAYLVGFTLQSLL